MAIENPFFTVGYGGPEYFCDRVEETEKLRKYLKNGWNITLVSPRKMGKTGLIHHLFHTLKDNDRKHVCAYVDIYATSQLSEFVELFCKRVFAQMESPSASFLKKLTKFFKSCRPVITTDERTGQPAVTLDFVPSKSEQTLKEIFEYIGQTDGLCCVAIDEFQQIQNYPEKNVEALLRSYIQDVPNVRFIFAGSQCHMMEEMFLAPNRPFYQSTRMLDLCAIDRDDYYEFARAFFEKRRCDLAKEAFDRIYGMFDGHTWYVQSMLNQLYMDRPGCVDDKAIRNAINAILDDNTFSYQRLFSLLTSNQRLLIKAIAKEGCVDKPTAGDFLSRHGFKNGSCVSRATKPLLADEYLYSSENGLIVYDRFFGMWLAQQ